MKAILQWVLKTMMKDKTGVVQTLPNKDLVDFNVAMTAERLMRNGIDPNSLKNANQVENAINRIEAPKNVQQEIKSAKVFDLEGKEIDPKKGIMGGKQIPDDDLPPPGSRGGPDDIAAPIQSEDEILEKLNRENKEATRNLQIKLSKDKGYQKFKGETEEEIRKRFGLDDPEDMATGGRAGFANGSKGLLDILNIQAEGSKSGKQQIKGAPEGFTMDNETYNFIINADIPIGEKINLLTTYGRGKGRTRIEKDDQELFLDEGGFKKRGIGLDFNPKAEKGFSGKIMYDPDGGNVQGGITYKFADGGRIGYKIGSIDKARRAFLKTAASIGGGIAALKTGMLGLTKGAAPAVEKAVETVTEAPSYFFDLVAKIKLFGKQKTTPSYKERVNEFTYTGKNGDQYELIEDMDTGEIMIQKDKMGVGVSGDKTFDTITDRTELRYKKPKPDEGDPNPTAEYEEYKVEFDADGTAADATEIDNLSKKEIIEEATKEAPSIKKAGGGIARMLGE